MPNSSDVAVRSDTSIRSSITSDFRPRRPVGNHAARQRIEIKQATPRRPATRFESAASLMADDDWTHTNQLLEDEFDDLAGYGMRTDWEFEAAMSRHFYAKDHEDNE